MTHATLFWKRTETKIELNEPARQKLDRRRSCQYAKHANLNLDLFYRDLSGGTFDGSGFSAEKTLISMSAVPYRGYNKEAACFFLKR